mgnify:FL=1
MVEYTWHVARVMCPQTCLEVSQVPKVQNHMCLIWRHTEPMGLKNIGLTL